MYLCACKKPEIINLAAEETFPLDTEAATEPWHPDRILWTEYTTADWPWDTKTLSSCQSVWLVLLVLALKVFSWFKGSGWVGFPVVQVTSPCYSFKQNVMTPLKCGKMNVPTSSWKGAFRNKAPKAHRLLLFRWFILTCKWFSLVERNNSNGLEG